LLLLMLLLLMLLLLLLPSPRCSLCLAMALALAAAGTKAAATFEKWGTARHDATTHHLVPSASAHPSSPTASVAPTVQYVGMMMRMVTCRLWSTKHHAQHQQKTIEVQGFAFAQSATFIPATHALFAG
jgi:hypothetical protein